MVFLGAACVTVISKFCKNKHEEMDAFLKVTKDALKQTKRSDAPLWLNKVNIQCTTAEPLNTLTAKTPFPQVLCICFSRLLHSLAEFLVTTI